MDYCLSLMGLAIVFLYPSADDYTLDQLVQLNQSTIAQLKKVELEFEEAVDGRIDRTGTWVRVGLKDLYTEETPLPDTKRLLVVFLDREKRLEKRFQAFNKDDIPRMTPGQPLSGSGIAGPLGRYHSEAVVESRLGLRFQISGVDDTLTLEELVAESDGAKVAGKREVNGVDCHVIELSRKIADETSPRLVRIYLDPTKDFLVAKTEIYFGQDDTSECFVGEIKLADMGGEPYFPVEARWKSEEAGGGKEKVIEFTTSNLRLNSQVQRGTLDYKFPANTWVRIWDVPINHYGPSKGFGFRLADGKGGAIVQFSPEQRKEYAKFRESLVEGDRKPPPDDRRQSVPAAEISVVGRALFFIVFGSSGLLSCYLVVQLFIRWRLWSKTLHRHSAHVDV